MSQSPRQPTYSNPSCSDRLAEDRPNTAPKTVISNILTILSNIEYPAETETTTSPALLSRSTTKLTSRLQTAAQQRKVAQAAWLSLLHSGLTPLQRKTILTHTTHIIIPWLQHPERLLDFLTDSYNTGGATSLLALSGLYHLIHKHNLDYPAFYPRLYSLLNDSLLHSKHRSRFFRLLNTFLASTHLPAALVASFIKKLARLALHGPPAGIVAVVPWIYNMLRAHPTCTFMLHRETRTDEERAVLKEHGIVDVFDETEPDPMLTHALESSLWELETLQAHYHPNVAALARIVAEQFTKPEYNLEDFLDLSYANVSLSLFSAVFGSALDALYQGEASSQHVCVRIVLM